MIKAVVFDLDNTLMDFMTLKDNAIRAAVKAMIDSGLDMDPGDAYDSLYSIYEEKGIEYQNVKNRLENPLKRRSGIQESQRSISCNLSPC